MKTDEKCEHPEERSYKVTEKMTIYKPKRKASLETRTFQLSGLDLHPPKHRHITQYENQNNQLTMDPYEVKVFYILLSRVVQHKHYYS